MPKKGGKGAFLAHFLLFSEYNHKFLAGCEERPARVKASNVVEKGCLTTKPRTFGLGISGRLSLLAG